MNRSNVTDQDSPAVSGAAIATRRRWLDGLTWKGMGLLAVPCVLNAMRRNNVIETTVPDLLRNLAVTLISGACLATIVALAVVATYNRTKAQWRWPALVSAVAISSFVGTLLLFLIDTMGTFNLDEFGGFVWAFEGTWPRYALLALLLTAVFVHVRAADDSEAATQRAEVDRIRFAQEMDEARLQVLQAQIEPHFLFNTLAQVRALYRADAALGASMLDALIAYLRAAMPTMRETTSTVERETTLVRAWIDVAGQRIGAPILLDVEASPAVSPQPLPAMMLLPLVERAIADGCRSIRLEFTSAGTRTRIAIAGRGVENLTDSEELAAVRERLTTLYGRNAAIAISSADVAQVVLELPSEVVPL